MLKKIPFLVASRVMVFFLSGNLIFHLLVVTRIIPYQIVWGGRLQSVEDMMNFEITSLLINASMLIVILIKSGYLKWNISPKVITVLLWIFVLLFSANTIGNLVAKTITETAIFTPITFISAILCLRLAKENSQFN